MTHLFCSVKFPVSVIVMFFIEATRAVSTTVVPAIYLENVTPESNIAIKARYSKTAENGSLIFRFCLFGSICRLPF